jgi:hypothetical protein
MRNPWQRLSAAGGVTTLLLAAVVLRGLPVEAQSDPLQSKVAEAQQLMVANRQQLGRYAWQTEQTVSVSGDVKQVDLYQVQLGPDGQPVRILVAQPVDAQNNGRAHGIRHRLDEKFQQYAQDVTALAKSYAQLDPAKIQALYAKGMVSVRSGGAPGYSAIAISKSLSAVDVSSYLSSPSDAVTIQVRYAALPDGTHYAATQTVNGQSRGLKVVDQSTNFVRKP